MNATKIIILICKLNIENTLTARKDIVKIRKFKKLMIFRIVFEKSKKILNLTISESEMSFQQRLYDARNLK